MEEILRAVSGEVFSVWFLIGAAFVFWMQAGFAMCEAGFTRAKNAGNIIMKNLMDFCIGTIMWFLLGASLMLGENVLGGFSGSLSFDVFTGYSHFDYSAFVFNLVFCATTATIVSGAMAERTKFISYCVYSAVISAVIYPIEAHWTWGGGFLAQMGFHDFAGSNCIHMVGGICALIGAWMLGPRIGKFDRNEKGKVTKVNAFPGHNLVIAALGVFILWLGWYGFNGAAATDVPSLGSIFLTTTVAPAVATVICMLFTWLCYGKPDVSMCLNASLAGLVAITAPCDVTDCTGAAVIGAVAGLLVVEAGTEVRAPGFHGEGVGGTGGVGADIAHARGKAVEVLVLVPAAGERDGMAQVVLAKAVAGGGTDAVHNTVDTRGVVHTDHTIVLTLQIAVVAQVQRHLAQTGAGAGVVNIAFGGIELLAGEVVGLERETAGQADFAEEVRTSRNA